MKGYGIIHAMKDWKTYAIIVLAVWCAYLTWRVSPAIVWQANNLQDHHRENVYWWFGKPRPERAAQPPALQPQTRPSGLLGTKEK